MSPTRQTNPGRLFMQSRSGSCSINIVSKIGSSLGWRAVQTEKMLCVVL